MKDVNPITAVPVSSTPLRRGSRRALTFLIAAVAASVAILHPGPLSAQSYLLSEGFEGAGFENTGWTPVGSIDPNYTASPLAGAQSLRCNGTSSYIQRAFVRSNDFYGYFQVRWLTLAPFKYVINWVDGDANSIAWVVTEGFPNRFRIGHGGNSVVGSTVLDTNITYHVWVEWMRGTGADGTMNLFMSTNGVKPGSAE